MAMMFSNCKPWRIDHGHGEFKDNYFDNNRQLDITISNMATRTGKDNYRFRSGRVRDRDKDRWSEPKTVQLEINYPHLQKNDIYHRNSIQQIWVFDHSDIGERVPRPLHQRRTTGPEVWPTKLETHRSPFCYIYYSFSDYRWSCSYIADKIKNPHLQKSANTSLLHNARCEFCRFSIITKQRSLSVFLHR